MDERTTEAPGPGAAGGTDRDGSHVDRFVAHGLLHEPCRLDVASPAGLEGSLAGLGLALRAATAEPLFEALELWLGTPFDVRPHEGADRAPDDPAGGAADAGAGEGADEGADADSAPPRVRLVARSGDGPSLTVHLPHGALGALPPIPRAVAETVDVRVLPLPALCRVARLSLTDDELEPLTPGAVLLLPGTSAQTWSVRLIAREVSIGGRLDVSEASLSLVSGRLGAGSEGRARDAAERDVDVVLDGPLAWDPLAALGGAGESRLALPAPLARCRFRCLIDGRVRFAGRVAAVGDGYGFFALERLDDPALASVDAPDPASATPSPTDDD